MTERRNHNKMSSAVICVLIVLVLGETGSSEGDNSSCSMVQRLHGEMVNIKKAKQNAEKNNGIVSVPKAATVNSSEDCEQGCCGNINCTVYLFYPRPPSDEHKNYNCFYLNCRPQNLCSLVNVSSKAEGAVVGIRDLQISGNAVEPEVTATLASVSASPVQPHADAGHEESSSTVKPNSTASTQQSTNATTLTESEASTTPVPVKVKKTKGNTNHTTYASLIIALGFGILFLFAVVVLIGRPWWYSFHRPRYSKVDYLMNGL